MYVYKDTVSHVTFKHPYPGPLRVEVFRGAEKLFDSVNYLMPASNDGSNNIYDFVRLDWDDTRYAGRLRLHWSSGTGFDRDQWVDVITPIVPLDYIYTALTEAGAANNDPQLLDQQVKEMENSVRLIVENYTGQKFNLEHGTRSARGLSELTLLLDNSVTIDTISPPLAADLYSKFTHLNIKQAPPEEYRPGFDGVIRVPRDYYRNTLYTVTGTWGNEEVPAAVQEAAMILISEYSCNEVLYRDRYLQSISYGDSRFQFNDRAWAGTGNAKADQLLDPFKREGMILV
jgi:hypothetical protein